MPLLAGARTVIRATLSLSRLDQSPSHHERREYHDLKRCLHVAPERPDKAARDRLYNVGLALRSNYHVLAVRMPECDGAAA